MEPRVLAGPPLVTREVDVIDRVDLKTVHLLSRQTDVVVEEVTGTQHYTPDVCRRRSFQGRECAARAQICNRPEGTGTEDPVRSFRLPGAMCEGDGL
jgi:hypothetical protein